MSDPNIPPVTITTDQVTSDNGAVSSTVSDSSNGDDSSSVSAVSNVDAGAEVDANPNPIILDKTNKVFPFVIDGKKMNYSTIKMILTNMKLSHNKFPNMKWNPSVNYILDKLTPSLERDPDKALKILNDYNVHFSKINPNIFTMIGGTKKRKMRRTKRKSMRKKMRKTMRKTQKKH